ncbi:hypothetical protein [Acinetobacter phage ABPH49]|nr:hypothetical protein [Acinetobacter phage ABPH49]
MMTKSHEERILFAQVNDMPMDFVDWFFDNKAPAISSSMVLCAAAFMYEGWKGRDDQDGRGC